MLEHTYTPTETTLSFRLASKDGNLNEENINRCYELVSSTLVALCRAQYTTGIGTDQTQMRIRGLAMDKVISQEICQDFNAVTIPTLEHI